MGMAGAWLMRRWTGWNCKGMNLEGCGVEDVPSGDATRKCVGGIYSGTRLVGVI